MKTHFIWLCIALAAFIVGTRSARREVGVAAKPVAGLATAKEAPVQRPVETIPKASLMAEPVAAPETRPPSTASRSFSVESRQLHERYDSFFARFHLTPVQRERFIELKLAIHAAQRDLQAAIEEKGVHAGTVGVEALRAELTKPMWDELRQLLGDDAFNAYGDYERLSAFRPVATALYTEAGFALSSQQTDQVARLILNHTQAYREKPTDMSSRTRIDWNAVALEAEAFLIPAHVEVIRAKAAREH